MTAEMPRRIAAAPGAAEVCFPWTHASTAVAALTDVAATLTRQLEDRVPMAATLDEWTGRYRDGFDTALTRLTTTATSLVESASRGASAVVAAAEDANEAQLVANRQPLLDRVDPFAGPGPDSSAPT